MPNDIQSLWPVRVWLWLIAALIALMVVIGGATRLTDSGLSITEWQPLLGAIPPLSESQWHAAFEKYKLIPEYRVQNRGMSLEEFKVIFWWEWVHRFFGRFIGVAFAIPLACFAWMGRLSRPLWLKLCCILALGGAQGALGWYMVSSGLSERIDVSQYRLAAHLVLAFAIFAAVVWVVLTLATVPTRKPRPGKRAAIALLIVIGLQIAAGGFVAGLDAGHASYTWPRINGVWWPDGMDTLTPAWRNAFENALAAQFNHRILAYLIVVGALVQLWRTKSSSSAILAAAVGFQVMLGILTIVLQVPLALALLHQFGALAVLAIAIWHLVTLTREPAPGPR